jgi:hypothetical protein
VLLSTYFILSTIARLTAILYFEQYFTCYVISEYFRVSKAMNTHIFQPATDHFPCPPSKIPKTNISISSYSHIGTLKVLPYLAILGARKTQEDRITICRTLVPNRCDCHLFAVFDGTVGDFVSDSAKDLIVGTLLETSAWLGLLFKKAAFVTPGLSF